MSELLPNSQNITPTIHDEIGVVVEVNMDGTAKVSLPRKDQCNGCRLCMMNPKGNNTLIVNNAINAKVNQRVKVDTDLSGKVVLKANVLIYLVPLVLMIISVIVCLFASVNEIITGIVAILITVISLFAVIKINSKNKIEMMPKITEILIDEQSQK